MYLRITEKELEEIENKILSKRKIEYLFNNIYSILIYFPVLVT